MDTNLILGSSNARTTASVLGRTVNDLAGVPLGKNGSELGVKVVMLNAGDVGQTGLPYGADNYEVISQVTAGPAVLVYKQGATVLKTRTITYTNGGASDTDTIVTSVDT